MRTIGKAVRQRRQTSAFLKSPIDLSTDPVEFVRVWASFSRIPTYWTTQKYYFMDEIDSIIAQRNSRASECYANIKQHAGYFFLFLYLLLTVATDRLPSP